MQDFCYLLLMLVLVQCEMRNEGGLAESMVCELFERILHYTGCR